MATISKAIRKCDRAGLSLAAILLVSAFEEVKAVRDQTRGSSESGNGPSH